MATLRRVLGQGLTYTLFQTIGMAVGLISFPFLTRLLTVEEYGYLALFNATLSMMLSLAKCGIPTSFIRSYANVSGDSADAQSALYTNALGTSLALAITISLAYTVALFVLNDYLGPALTQILLFGAVFILVQDLRDLFSAFFRAEEKVLTLSTVNLIIRAGSVAAGIFAATVLLPGLTSYLVGMLVFEAFVVALLAGVFIRSGQFNPRRLSLPTMSQLVFFGAPLLLFELSSLINDYADRFLINHFLGSAQVGIYSVGYNLAMYVQGLITAPLWMAVFPVYTKIWAADGPQKTSEFLGKLLQYYLRGAVLVALVISLVSDELITLLATEKYAAAAQITPYVIVSVLIYGATHITAAGFYLIKRTKIIALLTIGGATLNVLANLFLIPLWGILGAAYATTISYLILTVLITYVAGRLLPIPWPMRVTSICLAAAIAAFLIGTAVTHDNLIAALVLRSASAAAVYVTLLLLLDRPFRHLVVAYGRAVIRRILPH
jgi:O-antigen/teichoic acid export membrane protein